MKTSCTCKPTDLPITQRIASHHRTTPSSIYDYHEKTINCFQDTRIQTLYQPSARSKANTMADNQASHISGEDDHSCDGLDRLGATQYQIMQALDAKKKLAASPGHKETVPKLNKIIISMVDRLGKNLAQEDIKKEKYENGEIINMIYRSASLVEALSTIPESESSTEGISKYIDRLLEELASTHLEKDY